MTSAENWRKLKIGDKIRFVAMPTGFGKHNCHKDTLRAYRVLIERKRPVRVSEIDAWKMPWIRFQVRGRHDRLEYHSLLINHDGWVRVKHRKKKA